MKRIIVIVAAAVSLTACGDRKETETSTATDTVNTFADTSTNVISDNTTVSNAYVPAEGDVAYRDNKLMVYRNNNYVAADRDINLDSGVVVNRNGRVTRNGVEVQMEEGESMTRAGRFFDRTGNAIENGWDATKRGVKKGANAIGKGAKKVGEEVKDAVH